MPPSPNVAVEGTAEMLRFSVPYGLRRSGGPSPSTLGLSMNTSRKLDLWLTVTGIGSWVLFVASLALSGFWAAYVFPRMPESLANWLFWGSAVAATAFSTYSAFP
jgi:hypothetical protein